MSETIHKVYCPRNRGYQCNCDNRGSSKITVKPTVPATEGVADDNWPNDAEKFMRDKMGLPNQRIDYSLTTVAHVAEAYAKHVMAERPVTPQGEPGPNICPTCGGCTLRVCDCAAPCNCPPSIFDPPVDVGTDRGCPHCAARLPFMDNLSQAHKRKGGIDFIGWCHNRISEQDYQRMFGIAAQAEPGASEPRDMSEMVVPKEKQRLVASVKGASARAAGLPKDSAHGYAGENARSWLWGWEYADDFVRGVSAAVPQASAGLTDENRNLAIEILKNCATHYAKPEWFTAHLSMPNQEQKFIDRAIDNATRLIAEVRQRDGERIAELERQNSYPLDIRGRQEFEKRQAELQAAEARADSLQRKVIELESERDEWDRKEDSWKHAAIKWQAIAKSAESCSTSLQWQRYSLAATLEKVRETLTTVHTEALSAGWAVSVKSTRRAVYQMIVEAAAALASLSPASGTEDKAG